MPAPAARRRSARLPWGTSSSSSLPLRYRSSKHIAVHLARKAADDLAHLARLEQRGQALVGIACVVVDHREVARALGDEAIDQLARNAGRAEPAYQHRGTILHPRKGLGHRVRSLLIIATLSWFACFVVSRPSL